MRLLGIAAQIGTREDHFFEGTHFLVRQPKHPEFQERTAWSLLNAFTEVLKDRQQRQPSRAAHETITLQKLIGGEYGIPVQAV